MGIAVLTALILLPILELWVLVKVGGWIGILPLLMLLVGMAVAGSLVLRRQGLTLARRALGQVSRGEPPIQAMIDGVGLTIAGILMIVPGLITDVMGLALLVSPIRRHVMRRLIGRLARGWSGTWRTQSAPSPSQGPESGPGRSGPGQSGQGGHPTGGVPGPDQGPGGVVIDGEFERLDERTIRPGDGTSGKGRTGGGEKGQGETNSGAGQARPQSSWRR